MSVENQINLMANLIGTAYNVLLEEGKHSDEELDQIGSLLRENVLPGSGIGPMFDLRYRHLDGTKFND